MVQIAFGPMVADARGSIGGQTFARNSSGAYIRARTKPIDPNSPAQQLAKASMTVIVDTWLTGLTVAQRDAWNAAAALQPITNKLGQTSQWSGFNAYVRANQSLSLTGQAFVTAPPTQLIIPEPTLTLAHVPATGVQVSAIGDWDDTATDFVLISKSPALRQTINFFKSPFVSRSSQAAAGFAALPLTIDATADLVINTRKFYAFKSVNALGGAASTVIYQVDIGGVA